MKYNIPGFLILLILLSVPAIAQKPFTEGVIVYKVKLESPDQKEITGLYTYTIKGTQIRKELKLNNGYEDVVILNSGGTTAYSLQNKDGKKFAIELYMAEIIKKQDKFNGFVIKSEESNGRNIAGYAVIKGTLSYLDGSTADVYYTKEWCPAHSVTFQRFPGAKFMPMFFFYKDDNGMSMQFEAEKIQAGPVETGLFRIPADYKVISNAEYKQMNK